MTNIRLRYFSHNATGRFLRLAKHGMSDVIGPAQQLQICNGWNCAIILEIEDFNWKTVIIDVEWIATGNLLNGDPYHRWIILSIQYQKG